jgi:hypothetical protein
VIVPPLSERAARQLSNDLGVTLGFAIHPNEFETLIAMLPCDAATFVDAILRAEGMNPETVDRSLWRQVRDAAISRSRMD